MVARLTPDQKAACSSHVGVTHFFFLFEFYIVFSSLICLLDHKTSGLTYFLRKVKMGNEHSFDIFNKYSRVVAYEYSLKAITKGYLK